MPSLVSCAHPTSHKAPVPANIVVEHRILVGESAFLCDFTEAGVYALDRVRRVHDLAHSTAVREQLLDMREIVLPYRHSAGISRPVLAELLESLACLLDVHRTIDGLELFREAPPLLAWDIADGVANEMHDAPLHDHLREDGFSAVFKTRHTIHGEEADRAL